MTDHFNSAVNKNEIQSGLTTARTPEVMAQAIYNLEPGCKFGIRVNEEQELYPVWKEGDDLPSDSELNTEINRLNNEYDGQEYYRNRAEDYLAIGDQLDLIWHAIDEDEDLKTKLSGFYDAIKVTKDNYPKP
tara:strand:- start:56 stop:451 length:396 start_codon:yes stop_codon:yes gene_type:complete